MISKMKRTLLLFCFLLPLFGFAQTDSLLSGMYQWREPSGGSQPLAATVLFEGKVHDMEWLQMNAASLRLTKTPVALHTPASEEALLIVKEGILILQQNEKPDTITAGSIALLLPGEQWSLRNSQKAPATFYLMKYRSKQPVDEERGKSNGGSLVINWNKTVFKPHDKGGRRDFFERPTVMCKRMEMHVSTLNVGLKSHEPHTHRAEEIVLVTDGQTKMQIGDKFYKGGAGSIYYLGSNVPHAVQNSGEKPCSYFAFQFE